MEWGTKIEIDRGVDVPRFWGFERGDERRENLLVELFLDNFLRM